MDATEFPYRMDKTAFSVTSLSVAGDEEKAHWLAKTPEERLEALEFLRQIAYG